ncbi:MAG: COG1361 S-layer family protein [Candidatus Diapherotrites archaeon]
MKKILALITIALFVVSAAAVNLEISAVNYEPTPAIPGKFVEFWVHILNDSSNDAKDVVFNLEMEYPFSLKGESAEQNIDSIKAHQTALVKYEIFVEADAPGGSYDVKLSTGDDGGLDKEIEYFIDVKEREPKVELIGSSVKKGFPGEELEIMLTLRNVGKGKASDITVKIEDGSTVTATGQVIESKILPLGSSTRYIPEMAADEQTITSFTLSISNDADLVTYAVPLKIYYANDAATQEFSTESFIGIKVEDKPDLDVVISSIKPDPIPGGISEITFDIFNTGTGAANFLVIELESDKAQITDKKIFIGTLEGDDFDSFRTDFSFDLDFDYNCSVTVRMIYKDQNNETKQIEKCLPIEAPRRIETPGATGLVGLATGLLPVGVIIVAVVAAFYFLYWKKRKKK